MTMTAAKRLDCFPVMKIINGQLMNRISFQIKSRVKRCSLCERWASAALAAHLWAVTRRNGCTAARGPTCDLSASGPFINRVGQKLSTHFLLSHFRRHLLSSSFSSFITLSVCHQSPGSSHTVVMLDLFDPFCQICPRSRPVVASQS